MNCYDQQFLSNEQYIESAVPYKHLMPMNNHNNYYLQNELLHDQQDDQQDDQEYYLWSQNPQNQYPVPQLSPVPQHSPELQHYHNYYWQNQQLRDQQKYQSNRGLAQDYPQNYLQDPELQQLPIFQHQPVLQPSPVPQHSSVPQYSPELKHSPELLPFPESQQFPVSQYSSELHPSPAQQQPPILQQPPELQQPPILQQPPDLQQPLVPQQRYSILQQQASDHLRQEPHEFISTLSNEVPTQNVYDEFIQDYQPQQHTALAPHIEQSSLKHYFTENQRNECVTVQPHQQSRNQDQQMIISEIPNEVCQPENVNITVYVNTDLKSVKSRTFKCEHCGRIFHRPAYKTQHVNAVHLSNKIYKCKTCGKKFETEEKRNNHSLIHKAEKKYKCNKCTKSYTIKSDLVKHTLRIHQVGTFPLACSICRKGFIRSDHLRVHEIICNRKCKIDNKKV